MAFELIKNYVTGMTPGSETNESEMIRWQEDLYHNIMSLVRDEEDDDVAMKNVRGLVEVVKANMGKDQCFNFRHIGRYVGATRLTQPQKTAYSTILYVFQELGQHGAKLNIDWGGFRVSFPTRYQDKITTRIMGAFNINA